MTKPIVDETRNPWSTTSRRTAYENPWITVEHHDVIDPSGRPGIYGVVRPRSWALGVVPIFDNGDTLLVGQYRYAMEQYSWEIPEGGGERDVDPVASIQRELIEETGYRANVWLPLQTFALSNSLTDEIAMTWVAWDLVPGPAEPESTEDLQVWRLPFAEVVSLVDSGKITDAVTIVTVQTIELRRLRRQLPEALAAALAAKVR